MDLLAVQGTLKESSPTPQFESISSSALRLLHGPTLTSIHDHWKSHSFDDTHLCHQVMSLLFNILSRFVYPFSPKLPSCPGCHAALSRVACVVQQDFATRFKYSSVHTAIPDSLAIPPPNSPLLLPVRSFSKSVSLFTERNRSADLRELPSFLPPVSHRHLPRGSPLFLGHICLGWFLITVYLISSCLSTLRNPR